MKGGAGGGGMGGGRIVLMPGLVAAIAVLYCGTVAIEWSLGLVAPAGGDSPWPTMMPSHLVLHMGAAAYGIARVWAFHPMFSPKYWEWLEAAPWRPGMPLPLGPVVLNWRDLVVLG